MSRKVRVIFSQKEEEQNSKFSIVTYAAKILQERINQQRIALNFSKFLKKFKYLK